MVAMAATREIGYNDVHMNSKYNIVRIRSFVFVAVIFMSPLAAADTSFYAEMGLHFGGDTYSTITSVDQFGAELKNEHGLGEFLSLSAGILSRIGSSAVQASMGYKFDRAEASNGGSRISRYPVDLMLYRYRGPWRLGIGISYHLNPELTGSGRASLTFDDAVGVAIDAGFHTSSDILIGLRFTAMDYSFRGLTLDAGSAAVIVGFTL